MKLSNVQNPCFPSSLLFSPFFPLSPFPLFLSLSLSPCTPVSKVYNRVLALDEVVQFTEEDEWAYHEMAANVPLFSHPNPRSVSCVPAITLELLLLCHCTVVSSSSCRFFSHSPPVPHLLPVSFSLTSLSIWCPYSTFLPVSTSSSLTLPSLLLSTHLTRCWW